MRPLLRRSLCVAVALAAAISPRLATRADTILDTTGAPAQLGQRNFGIPDTQTYGQTITAPLVGGDVLTGFSFNLNVPSTLAFRGEVYAWDGTKATGPSLYESDAVSTSGAGDEVVSFNTGGVGLIGGSQYVLFISSSKDDAGHSGSGTAKVVFSDAYAGGGFVFLNNGGDASAWTTSAWGNRTSFPEDMVFTATFASASPSVAAAPLPSTAWTGLGLMGVMGIARALVRRRKPIVA